MNANARWDRRRFLLGLGVAGGLLAAGNLLQACASTGTPSPSSTSTAAVDPALESLATAAAKEGKLSLIVPPGDQYRQTADVFQKKYGVAVELLAGNGPSDLAPRVGTERKAGQYLWDAVMHSPGALFLGFGPLNALDVLRPALILPAVTDDASWIGGFAAGYVDKAKSTSYGFSGTVTWIVQVNRSIIPQAQLSKLDQLWDPAWKGKIAMQDPTVDSSGSVAMSTWLTVKGADRVAAFLKDQNPVLTQDRRQLAEWLVRGTYPLGIGVAPASLVDLKSQGADTSAVQPLMDVDKAACQVSGTTGAFALFSRAPHPNAAKLFANWLLSAEGQQVWSSHVNNNSRRTDVPPVSAAGAIDPKRQYVSIDNEDSLAVRLQGVQLAKSVLNH